MSSHVHLIDPSKMHLELSFQTDGGTQQCFPNLEDFKDNDIM